MCEWTKYNLYDQHRPIIHIATCLESRKKKAQAIEEDPNVEIITRVEVIYEDTKAITGIHPEYKWGDIYRMISNQSVL